jgi:hypothetical protein
VWFFGMAPGDPQTVAAWSPATGQLASGSARPARLVTSIVS